MGRAAGNDTHYVWRLYDKSNDTYVEGADISLPSVTSIIHEVLAAPQLQNWYSDQTIKGISTWVAWQIEHGYSSEVLDALADEDMVREILEENRLRPVDMRDDSADRGKEKHDMLEQLANTAMLDSRSAALTRAGEMIESDDPYAHAIGEWWMKRQPMPLMAEAKLRSLQHGYAGQCDLIYKTALGNNTVITDLKTGNAGRRMYLSDQLQVVAYELAFREQFPNVNVAARSVLVAREDGTHQEYGATAAAEMFLDLLDFYKRSHKLI